MIISPLLENAEGGTTLLSGSWGSCRHGNDDSNEAPSKESFPSLRAFLLVCQLVIGFKISGR